MNGSLPGEILRFGNVELVSGLGPVLCMEMELFEFRSVPTAGFGTEAVRGGGSHLTAMKSDWIARAISGSVWIRGALFKENQELIDKRGLNDINAF